VFIIRDNILENKQIRITLREENEKISEGIEFINNRNWIPILSSLDRFSTLIFNNNKKSNSILPKDLQNAPDFRRGMNEKNIFFSIFNKSVEFK